GSFGRRGGRGPGGTAPRAGPDVSSGPARGGGGGKPPRPLSPPPTKATGERKRSGKKSRHKAEDLFVAMPPGQKAAPPGRRSAGARASRSSGRRYRASLRSTRTRAQASSTLGVMRRSGSTSPPPGVMTQEAPNAFA